MAASLLRRAVRGLAAQFDSSHIKADPTDPLGLRPDPSRFIPYLVLHLGVLGVLWVGVSPIAVAVAAILYVVRMFAVTGIYHRYFSHRAYRTNRFWQFVFAVWGNAAAQRGPLWWAAQHRRHHAHSDEPEDAHSPIEHGLYWSHLGWLTARSNLVTDLKLVPDLAKFPELRFLDRYDILVPLLLAAALYGFGAALEAWAPGLGTSGWQMVVWGFFVSTVVLFHCTCFINSLAHLMGSKRYKTGDESRNNLALAVITMGEGWHNNHHHYPSSARQGFYWWEIDITYYILKMISWTGIIWDLRPVPKTVLEEGRGRTPAAAPKASIAGVMLSKTSEPVA
ncbi:MAG: hypothetical protein AMXMBFR47_24470 [Planctomycetota bacterium]